MSTTPRRRILSSLLVLAIVAAACGGGDSSSNDTAPDSTPTTTAPTTTEAPTTTTEAPRPQPVFDPAADQLILGPVPPRPADKADFPTPDGSDDYMALFEPGAPWATGGMSACARDMARFGQMMLNGGHFGGKRIGLCCNKCKAKFDKNPAKYAAKLK